MFVMFFSFLLWLCMCDIFNFLLLHNKLPQILYLKSAHINYLSFSQLRDLVRV